MLGANKRRSLFPFTLPVVESFGDGFAVVGDGNKCVYRRTLGHGCLNLTDNVSVIYADDGFDGGTGIAVHDVVLGQHVGRWNDDGTDLVKGEHDDPPFITALQDEHHGVVLTETQ